MKRHGKKVVGQSMREPDPVAQLLTQRDARYLPGLLALFLLSGCAALIYEIVWFQALELSIGSSAMSIAVLLATFMGGMCIGSLGIARSVGVSHHPLRVYGCIEFGIGTLAVLVLVALPYAGGIYASVGGNGFGGLVVRGLISTVCLLPPTILMGATLPAVSRWVESTAQGAFWMGLLYGGNTIGAFAGCLLAGFYLLPRFDMWAATYVAVVLNVIVGAVAFLIARSVTYRAPAAPAARSAPTSREPDWPVLVTIGLSGMTALASEVVWTRLLSLQLGATVYTYSLILAAVLIGIGAGGYAGSLLIRLTPIAPRILLGACQALVMAGIAWAAYLINVIMPMEPKDAALSANAVIAFGYGMSRSLWAVLPAALLWGASFSLAMAAVEGHDADPGRAIGGVYAANTAGAIVGALSAPLLLLPAIGSQHLQQTLVFIAAAGGSVALWPRATARSRKRSHSSGGVNRWLLPLSPFVLAGLVTLVIPPVSAAVVGYGPGSYAWNPAFGEFIYVGEGMNGDVAISRNADGVLNYHNAGKVQASSQPGDLRLQRMLGHLTTLQQSDPESVLVIGCGAGVTAGAVSVDPAVKRLTIVEIEPLVPRAAQQYMAGVNEAVIANPKTTVVIDDGRHYLMTSKERFDAITLDPFDPWTKGAAALSTVEFYESVRDHLKPGGTVTVWVPLYQTRAETVKSEIATFMTVFPNAVIWENVSSGAGDVVLSGRAGDEPIDVDATEARLARPDYQPVRRSLQSVGFTSASSLFGSFGVRGADLTAWLAGAEINTDRNLRLQYLAGSSLGTIEPERIYADMAKPRTWPEGLFVGSEETLKALRESIIGQ